MIKSGFEYLVPESLSDAYDFKKKHEEAAYIGGGTDYIPLLKYDLKKPETIISLGKIMELKKIEADEKGMFIGSMVTLEEIHENRFVIDSFQSLARAAQSVASPQIRNMGTIGGNILQDRRCMYFNQSEDWRSNLASCFKIGGSICHQAPKSEVCRALYYSDIAPVLLSLDAEAEIYDGELIRMPVSHLIKSHIERNGRIKTNDFILKGFYIPYLPEDSWAKFGKYSLRASIDFPAMNIAARYSKREESCIVRIIAGAVSPVPIELNDIESMIVNHLDKLEEYKKDIVEGALSELTKKSCLIRETGISINAKRNAFKNILRMTDGLISAIIKK
ncbi:FAD binding domain-containing protein [Lutispora saccharofermentans]|uniref:FAD binding domain-containing protein n=1 Tax=Lutispora saccharofermentans TaxID=3024236 RepID=A0ABT1NE01_9FIRM|nr:FAD binding domain-containing protein [Lutispora saccharofermentans]MCQ1528859.1 FAD binding domain-containing protein [Lutispora saccharofermentans]